MGPIQSGINQSLAILSLASSQSPKAQTVRRNTAETELGKQTVKASDKYYQGAQKSINENSFGKAPSVEMHKPEAAKEAFELKQKGLNQQLEAAKERGDYKSIESLKKQIADIEENKFMYGLDGEEPIETYPEDVQPIVQKATQQAQAQVQQKKVRRNSVRLLKDILVRKQNMKEDAFNKKDVIRKKEDK